VTLLDLKTITSLPNPLAGFEGPFRGWKKKWKGKEKERNEGKERDRSTGENTPK